MGMSSSETVVKYYINKHYETKILLLGSYGWLSNSLKKRMLSCFLDCKKLVEKIKSRGFKIRSGLEEIVKFYNANCGTESR